MVDLMRKPDATRVIEQLREGGSRFADSTLPNLARSARETGRSVADLAQSAGRTVVERLPGHKASPVRRAVSGGVLRSATRVVTRRPVMALMGGVALAGLIVAVRQRMKAMREERAAGESAQGEAERTQGRRDEVAKTLADKTGRAQRRGPKTGLEESNAPNDVDDVAEAAAQGGV